MALKSFVNVLKRSQSPTTTGTPLMSFYSSCRRYGSRDLFARILPLGDPKQSIVPVLDKWVQQGKEGKVYPLRRIIRDLRSRRRHKHALEVSEWMSSKQEGALSSCDHAIRLDLIGIVRGVDDAESYFNSLNDQNKDEKTYGALLNCFVRKRLTDKSLSLFQKMKEMGFAKDPLNYNCLMCLYTKTGQPERVPHVLSEMKEAGVPPDAFSYRILLNSYGTRSDLDNMEKVLKEMESQQHVILEWTTYAVVANYLIKAHIKERALTFLKKCEEKVHKDSLGYNHLISLYASLGDDKEVTRLWNLKKAMFKRQSNKDYMTMLGSLVKLSKIEEAELLLQEWEKSSKFYDFRVPNILLIAYCQKGLIEKAQELLYDIVKQGKTPIPNSWAIVAAGYVNVNNMEKAFECMKEALALVSQNEGWQPKIELVLSILNWLKLNKAGEVEPFLSSLKTIPLLGDIDSLNAVPHILENLDHLEANDADGTDEDNF